MTIQSVVSSYDTLMQTVIAYTGNNNPEVTSLINNDIRLMEADTRNLRLPLMKTDPWLDIVNETNVFVAQVDNEGQIPIPSDLLEPIYFFQLDPLVQYNRRGAQEVQREAYENRYGVFGASSDVWVSYQGEFGNAGRSRYQITPRPTPGTRIYLYYYQDWDSLGPNGFNVTFSGTATGSGTLSLPLNESGSSQNISISFTTGETAETIASRYVVMYNSLASTGTAGTPTTSDGTTTVTVSELFTASEDSTTIGGITFAVNQVITRDNFLIRQAPDLYLNGTLKHYYTRLRNSEQRDFFANLYDSSIRSLMEADTRAEKKGGRRTKRTKWAPRRRGSLRS